MYFDLAAFIRFNYKSFFKAKGTNYRLTPKRILVLLIWLGLYIPAQVINRVFMLVDEVFFPAYRRQPVTQPVFIIGNPRSGTTFLHRLIEKDKESYSSFIVWELFLAPSITQKKLIRGFAWLMKTLGAPVQKVMKKVNRHMSLDAKAHPIRVDSSEEDDHILIHNWSSATLWGLYPIPEELMPYFYFDRDIPLEKQDMITKAYRNLVQRHLYANGGKVTLLAKNPAQTAKIASLQRWFPDARFINLARNPFEALPSMANYMSSGWKVFCDPIETNPYRQELLDIMAYYYRYPIEYFGENSQDCLFLKYEDLVREPEIIVRDVYEWLGKPISADFEAALVNQTQRSRNYKSEHEYSLEGVGYTEGQVAESLADILSFYEFESQGTEVAEGGLLWQVKNWQQHWKTRQRPRSLIRALREHRFVQEKPRIQQQ